MYKKHFNPKPDYIYTPSYSTQEELYSHLKAVCEYDKELGRRGRVSVYSFERLLGVRTPGTFCEIDMDVWLDTGELKQFADGTYTMKFHIFRSRHSTSEIKQLTET